MIGTIIRHGTRPTRLKHNDYDYLKSRKFGATRISFPDEFFADAGLTMPTQNAPCTDFMPPTPAMPYGCTNFTDADLATDLTGRIHNPNDVEAITHANALGGYDIRASLDACLPKSILHPERLGWFQQYFNIRARGVFDYFDAFRTAQLDGMVVNERRSITWGTPWFPSWQTAIEHGETIMPMPSAAEIKSAYSLSWHDSKLDGWTTKNGRLVYRDKSWQGSQIGDRGFVYFPREVINTVMKIKGTIACTPTNNPIAPLTVDVTTLQWLISIMHTLLEKYLPTY